METCPRCGSAEMHFPALSRTDNRTHVCSDCGRLEALEQFAGSLSGEIESQLLALQQSLAVAKRGLQSQENWVAQ